MYVCEVKCVAQNATVGSFLMAKYFWVDILKNWFYFFSNIEFI